MRLPRLALVADDLTGAADSGVQFVKRGLQASLVLNGGWPDDADVLVANTESRGDPPETAYRKVYAACSLLPSVRYIYKKIDSTLRGNVGAELQATMDARHLGCAVVAPAYPDAGRTTLDGRQLLHGSPLEDTEFSRDPVCPITDSYVPRLLSQQMRCMIGLIGLNTVREGVGSLTKALRTRQEAVLVVDALADEDLQTIAQAACEAGASELTSGSAGFADAIASMVVDTSTPLSQSRTQSIVSVDGPVLVVAASRNPVTGLQVSNAARKIGLVSLSVDAMDLAHNRDREVRRLIDIASAHLLSSRDVALSATDSPYVAGLSNDLAEALGEAASCLADGCTLAGLVLTGGDTAVAVCRALGAESLTLLTEVSPGIPLGRVHGGPQSGLLLVTKAGGFGQVDAIAKAIACIRGS